MTEERKAFYINTPRGPVELKVCVFCTELSISNMKCPTMKEDMDLLTTMNMVDKAMRCPLYDPIELKGRQLFDERTRILVKKGGVKYGEFISLKEAIEAE